MIEDRSRDQDRNMKEMFVCLFVFSPAPNLHYLRGFDGRAEAWKSFTELETFFTHSGHQNNIAREHSPETLSDSKPDITLFIPHFLLRFKTTCCLHYPQCNTE